MRGAFVSLFVTNSPQVGAAALRALLTAKFHDVAPEEPCDATLMRPRGSAKRTWKLEAAARLRPVGGIALLPLLFPCGARISRDYEIGETALARQEIPAGQQAWEDVTDRR